jgi:diacylglycerol kinase family enzyme
MIGIGFDAEVVRRLAAGRTGHITRVSYVKPLLAALRSYQYPEVRVYCDRSEPPTNGSAEAITARWVFGVNLPVYSMGLRFAPAAVATDGRLDVCTFERGSFLQGLRYFMHLVGRRHLRLPDTGLTACRAMRVEAVGEAVVPYQLDGDPGGELPVEVTIERGRFTAIVSAARARVLTGGNA